MSARKIDPSGLPQPFAVQGQTTRLDLPQTAVRVRKNGIEFRSTTPIPVWTEMTVAMQSPQSAKKISFMGVIVACNGNRHTGYLVSMLFTNVSKQAQAQLNSMLVSY